MWAIAKIKNSSYSIFKEDLKKKLNNVIFYRPQYINKIINKRKILSKKNNLFHDYIFCFHDYFKNQNLMNSLIYTKGLKYFLANYYFSQNNIKDVISFCKSKENKLGFIEKKIIEDIKNNKLVFLFGPFQNLIFSVESRNKKKISFYLGNIKTSVNRF